MSGTTITLGPRQTLIARMILANGRSRGLGVQGQKVALMTALQESKLRMYANDNPDFPGIEESLMYPHDAVGHDHDSVNMFQQRPPWGGRGTLSEQLRNLMNPDYAINAFYNALQRVSGWRDMRPGQAAQKVQVSAFPDAYDKWESAAEKIIAAYPEGS